MYLNKAHPHPVLRCGLLRFISFLAVWRHVRLKKNFVNRETIPHVGVKLRIPEVLLVEKMRTQQRFNVSEARTWAVQYDSVNANTQQSLY